MTDIKELRELLEGEIDMAATAVYPEERVQHAKSALGLLDQLITALRETSK